MTPLQQAARNIILRWDSPLWKYQVHTAEYVNALRVALEAEQAQSVEPVGYLNLASVKLPGEKHPACEFSYERNNNAAAAIPLYIHPAPSPAKAQQVAEQAQAVEPVARISITQHGSTTTIDNTFDDCVMTWPIGEYKLYTHPSPPPAEAQQVAVPDKREPLTFDQIDALENRVYMQTTHKGRPMFEYVNAIIRAVEKHHGIGDKP